MGWNRNLSHYHSFLGAVALELCTCAPGWPCTAFSYSGNLISHMGFETLLKLTGSLNKTNDIEHLAIVFKLLFLPTLGTGFYKAVLCSVFASEVFS